jgi:eukaryotic-like serine/threonine-protein kinase
MTPGTKLGPYEILSQIGAGGMGEVYRARDPKLARDVAIKVLPEVFARDAERMARFQREAKVLASLSHPNIATIYGLEDSSSTRALVMELVEGPTLADRIKAGPIPVDEAVRIARQIADALEYAHERGIIHRDLKPANIKVAADDTVKVLDFGLAKALESDATSIDISTSPTISRMATQQGVLLGTAAYMSPEQAKAKPVDRRADIWAFGCVLYEMLTGKQAFTGETVTDTLASLIKEEPDWKALPAAIPMRVRVLLQRCLQKDPKQRLQAIGDARISLDEVLSGAPEAAPGVMASALPAWRRALPWALLAAMTVAFGTVAFVHFVQKPTAAAAPVQRFEIAAPDPSADSGGALSPDGRWFVFGGSGGRDARLWLRRMDSLEANPIAGTENANDIPFWSSDSRFIAFGTADGKLKKIDTEGGPAQVVCDAGAFVLGGFWTPDGKIVFGDPTRPPGLWVVAAAGGVSSPLPGLEQVAAVGRLFPVPLPDGRHFLYYGGTQVGGDVYAGLLDSNSGQNPKKLLTGIAPGLAYAPSPDDPNLGYVLFVRPTVPGARAGTLMAQPFNVGKLESIGEPVPVAQGVSVADFSASLTGTLVYGSATSTAGLYQLALFDRQGKVLGTVGEPGNYTTPAFSPDGKRLVAGRLSVSNNGNLWMMDLARGISTRFTFDSGPDAEPIWSPDGSHIAFASGRGGHYEIYQKLSNGGSEDELLVKSENPAVAHSWSGDGRFLLFGDGAISDATESVLPLDKDAHVAGKPFRFVQKGVGFEGKFSPGPNGQPLWVAYSSSESGRYEIYVRPFDSNSPTGTPAGGGKWQVSTDGGMSSRWNSNGKELFYVAPDGTVMSVQVGGSSTAFQSSAPKPLFKPNGLAPQTPDYVDWDASSDGKKFIFMVSPSGNTTASPAKFTVVLNWPSLLKK